MNVPEYGDEGCRPFRNAYAPNRTRRLNGSHIGRAGNAPRLDGNVGHTKRVAAGARRQEAQLRNPAFFHDDRFPNGESKRTDANDIDNGKLPAAIEGKKIASRVTMRPSNSAASVGSALRASHAVLHFRGINVLFLRRKSSQATEEGRAILGYVVSLGNPTKLTGWQRRMAVTDRRSRKASESRGIIRDKTLVERKTVTTPS